MTQSEVQAKQHWTGEKQPVILVYPCLRSGCRLLFRRFHQGQGDNDAEQAQPASDIKRIDVAAEQVLGLTGYEPGRDGADSIG